MKKENSKKINQIFSIPLEVSKELHALAKKREMSRKNALRKAYQDANEDEGQQEAVSEWGATLKIAPEL